MLDLFSILKTQQARFEFMKGLIRVAKSDGKILEEEMQFFNNLAQTMQIDENSLLELQKYIKEDTLIKLDFENHDQKMVFLIESIQLCYIDEDYSNEERDEINKIATELDISKHAVDEIEKWVIEGIKWSNRVNDLFTLK